ncbi:septum formation protein Maf [Opitutaceae bacterium TAV4]|nr:septum formation protein Maf [Opitutaceae bacterium TAV4]RRJ98339.1 septum formation protein Maf [Opitutaceae bacterium TAV3]
MISLILASASPRRRELLAQLGIPFEVIVADVTEHEEPALDPREMVSRNAALKAEWASERHPDRWVLGADTTVYIEGHALNKPADTAEARAMLRRLSGRTHTVFTGLALRHHARGIRDNAGESTHVTFKPLDEAAIDAYLARVHTLDKAGGYAIQEHGDLIIASCDGSLSNVIGLPLETLQKLLARHGIGSSAAGPHQERPPHY